MHVNLHAQTYRTKHNSGWYLLGPDLRQLTENVNLYVSCDSSLKQV